MKRLFYIALAFTLFTSCEDPFDIDIEKGEEQLVVDAFINSRAEPQKIILTKSVDFFEANEPPAAMGAQVGLISNSGQIYSFSENPLKPGVYEWEPDSNLPDSLRTGIGTVGDTLNLFIAYESDTFTSISVLKRTTPIDSVILYLKKAIHLMMKGFMQS